MKKSSEIQALIADLKSQHKEISKERDELEQLLRTINRQLFDSENQLRLAQAKEAEEDYLRSLAPDFNDPEFQLLLEALRSTPQFQSLRDFQREGLAKILWRYLIETSPTHTGSRGFINADDAGLGKTLTTVAFLATLEALENNTTNEQKEVAA